MYFPTILLYVILAPAAALIPSFIPKTTHKYSRTRFHATDSENDHFVSKTFGSIFSASIIAVSCVTAFAPPSNSAPAISERAVSTTVDNVNTNPKIEKWSYGGTAKTSIVDKVDTKSSANKASDTRTVNTSRVDKEKIKPGSKTVSDVGTTKTSTVAKVDKRINSKKASDAATANTSPVDMGKIKSGSKKTSEVGTAETLSTDKVEKSASKKISEVEKLTLELKREKTALLQETKVRDGYKKRVASLQSENAKGKLEIESLEVLVKSSKVEFIKANDAVTKGAKSVNGLSLDNERLKDSVDKAKNTLESAERELDLSRLALRTTEKIIKIQRALGTAEKDVSKHQLKITENTVKIAADKQARVDVKKEAQILEKLEKVKNTKLAKETKIKAEKVAKKQKEKLKLQIKAEKVAKKREARQKEKQKKADKIEKARAKMNAKRDAAEFKRVVKKLDMEEAKQLKRIKDAAAKEAVQRVRSEIKLERETKGKAEKEAEAKVRKAEKAKKVEEEKAKLKEESILKLKRLEKERRALEDRSQKSEKARVKAALEIVKQKKALEKLNTK